MLIGILHDSLNYFGGAERVSLDAISALKEAGFKVILGTIDKTNWGEVERRFGSVQKPHAEYFLSDVNLAKLRLQTSRLLNRVCRKLGRICDLLICTCYDLGPFDADIGYMNGPPYYIRLALGQAHGSGFLSRAYDLITAPMQRARWHGLGTRTLLANSRFTARLLRRFLGVKARVVYPGVDLARFSRYSANVKSMKAVITVGRFSPEKNFEEVLNIAKRVPEATFYICGTYSGIVSRIYLENLRKRIRKDGIANILIKTNPTDEELGRLLNSSEVFLNPSRMESFGIAVVEAMAAGLVPVVRRFSGPWEDILSREEGLYGYSYSDEQEAAERIRGLLTDASIARDISQRNRLWVENFSVKNFKENIVRCIEEMA